MATNKTESPKKKQKVESKDEKIKRLEIELRDIGDIHRNITSILSNTIDELNYDLIKTLESYKQFIDVDIVIIENQPTLKNPKMKAISSALYNYFLIRGIFDKKINKSNIT